MYFVQAKPLSNRVLATQILKIGVGIASCNIGIKSFDDIILKTHAHLLPRVQFCSFALELFRPQ